MHDCTNSEVIQNNIDFYLQTEEQRNKFYEFWTSISDNNAEVSLNIYTEN
jgi:hypothetical protein